MSVAYDHRAFKAREVRAPDGGRSSWTIVGPDFRPVVAVDRYLEWLTCIERSPNTVRAYAHDLKLFFSFLLENGYPWDEVTLEQLGEFVAWLRRPASNVIVLNATTPAREASTVARAQSAVFGLYEFHARHGVPLAQQLVARGRSGNGAYKPFLEGIAKSANRGKIGRIRTVETAPKTLTVDQVQQVLSVQTRWRDLFLFGLLFETGMRVGQALGMRHEDVLTWERSIVITPREDNANGARGKNGVGKVPISDEVTRLHSEYMHEEYGDLDSDYVFVNLWAGDVGAPMRYSTVIDLCRRTSRKVGFAFTPHTLRHTNATLARRGGMPMDVLQRLMTHKSQISTTRYAHVDVDDIRAGLGKAGLLGVGRV